MLIAAAALAWAQEAPAPPARPFPPVRALTFNVRYGTAPDGDNAWDKRKDLVLQVLAEERADVVAVQEALAFQLDFVLEKLPRYRASGAFRRGGREDEWTGILLDQERFDVEKEGQFWLSETPDKVGSVGWDAALPRLCAWVVVKERSGGDRFAVFATHLDHAGGKARAESMRLILARARAIAPGLPALLLGDLNAGEDAPPLHLARAAGFVDSFRVAHPDAQECGTFHGFQGGGGGAKIDYVLCSAEWRVADAGIVRTEAQGRYSSDHYPVRALLSLGAAPAASEPPAPVAPG